MAINQALQTPNNSPLPAVNPEAEQEYGLAHRLGNIALSGLDAALAYDFISVIDRGVNEASQGTPKDIVTGALTAVAGSVLTYKLARGSERRMKAAVRGDSVLNVFDESTALKNWKNPVVEAKNE